MEKHKDVPLKIQNRNTTLFNNPISGFIFKATKSVSEEMPALPC